MKQTMKAWTAGTNTLVITIPKNIIDLQKIEAGDYINIDFEKVENETTKLLKEELNKTKIKDKTKKFRIEV